VARNLAVARKEIPAQAYYSHTRRKAAREGEGISVSDDGSDNLQSTQFHYHLELTPAQLKLTHTALRSLLDDFGHDQSQVLRTIHEVLDKLPDEHAIRAIQLDQEIERQLTSRDVTGDEPPTAA
jgi:hypothetical protein